MKYVQTSIKETKKNLAIASSLTIACFATVTLAMGALAAICYYC